jgi:simple sugar transport system permease protein
MAGVPARVTIALPRTSIRWRAYGASLAAVVLALLVGAILVAVAGGAPLSAYRALLNGAIGSPFAVGQLLTQAIPLVIVGLGVALAFRGRVYNIGAEGQLYMGALAAGVLVIVLPVASPALLWLAAAVAGAAGGAFWGWIVGGLRARWGVNEVITSLLLNYVAILLFTYMVRQPFKDPGATALEGERIPDAAQLPLVAGLQTHVGLFAAAALVPLVGYLMARTAFGFRVNVLGRNAEAAEAVGIARGRMIVWLMLISGGLAGIAGAIQILGVSQRLDASLSQGYGFTAIVVALLGRLRATGVLLAALFIAGLSAGGQAMSVVEGLPYSIVLAIQGAFVVFLLVADRLARS